MFSPLVSRCPTIPSYWGCYNQVHVIYQYMSYIYIYHMYINVYMYIYDTTLHVSKTFSSCLFHLFLSPSNIASYTRGTLSTDSWMHATLCWHLCFHSQDVSEITGNQIWQLNLYNADFSTMTSFWISEPATITQWWLPSTGFWGKNNSWRFPIFSKTGSLW